MNTTGTTLSEHLPAVPVAQGATEAAPGDVMARDFRIDRLQILTRDECQYARGQVFASRDLWTQRDDQLPFYTLGIAGYLDASSGRASEYKAKALEIRSALEDKFGYLYDRVRTALESLLGQPCIYGGTMSLPGFHIFLHHPEIGSTESGSVHFDLQAENFDWSACPGADLKRQLSFTLSVRLPAQGSGLLVWNVNEKLLRQLSPEKQKSHLAANRTPSIHPYVEGEMVVHTGQFLHQIARPKESRSDDERITFQGHALFTDAGWLLYW